MLPKYNLEKIKFGTDPGTYQKAVALYESNKVTNFTEELNGYFSIVLGTKPYKVYVLNRYYDRGGCECYLGQNEILCKHLVATAIYAVMGGKKMSNEDKEMYIGPNCSKKIGELSKTDLALIKKTITSALRYIKAYEGPSRIWFAYQGSLREGCARLSKIISDLPVSQQTASIIVDILLRADNKLTTGGVDDSDGIVGSFITETVAVLKEYVQIDPLCQNAFEILKEKETCFGWEESLVEKK
jgi:hypothetical protein